jgi:hypothetical protein
MKVSNKLGLPDPFVRAVSQKTYDNQGSWRSVTELIGPAKISHLRRLHADDIEVDASELVYTIQGETAHALLERAAKSMREENWMSELRIHHEVMGKSISGAFDLYNPRKGELIDFKVSTAWKAKNEIPEEWTNQTNLLAHLIRQKMLNSSGKPHKVESIKILLIMRDHSKLEAKRDETYPQQPVKYIDIPVWSDDKCREYLSNRVVLHLKAEQQQALCSPEERWAKPTIWAIKKIGSSKAIPGGLYADIEKAQDALAKLGKGYLLEHRPGENVRCENYCNVSKWCEQYQIMKGNK